MERVAAVAIAVVVAASSAAVYLAAESNAISLPLRRFILASAAVLPVGYAFAGIGHAIVGWRPRLAVIALGAIAAVSYLVQQFAPLFEWPDWVKNARSTPCMGRLSRKTTGRALRRLSSSEAPAPP